MRSARNEDVALLGHPQPAATKWCQWTLGSLRLAVLVGRVLWRYVVLDILRIP